jgi:hypothetical protein
MTRTIITQPDGSIIRVDTKGGCSAVFTIAVVILVAVGPGYWAANGTWPVWGAVLAYPSTAGMDGYASRILGRGPSVPAFPPRGRGTAPTTPHTASACP